MENQNEQCLAALLEGINAGCENKKLLSESLDLTDEIVHSALTFPEQVKTFFNRLELVPVDVINQNSFFYWQPKSIKTNTLNATQKI